MDTIELKLNKADSLLAKIRYHVDSKFLKTIYSAIQLPMVARGNSLNISPVQSHAGQSEAGTSYRINLTLISIS